MDYRNKQNMDPWDDRVYGTGNTSPPKNYSGIIALLLILVIFLSGIVSLLSFMNIKLFQELKEQARQMENQAPMSFDHLDIQSPAPETIPEDELSPQYIQSDVSLNLNGSPQSVENIPEQGAMSWQDIYKKNIPSVVSILSATETGAGNGSGVILSEKGYIVTTCHIVSDAETLTVTLHDGRSYSAVVVGADPLTDLAVIYVDAPDLQGAEFGDSHALRVGDSVAALGGDMNGSMNNGIISAINRNVPFLGKDISIIQSNAARPDQCAGGALVNCYGQVIGINTCRLGMEEVVEGFAIPSTTVKGIVDQLIAQGYVSGRPTLGLKGDGITRFDQYYFHIPEGLYLEEVDPHSDAYALGIAPGHILLRLDGQLIISQTQLDVLVNSMAIGDTVEAVFYRDGREQVLTLTVTEYAG